MTISQTMLRNIVPDNSALTVDSCMTIAEALELMDRYRRHAVGVTVNGYFAGLFTRSDFINRVARNGLHPQNTAVGSVMTLNPVVISAQSGIREAYYLMCYDGYSHLPVVDDNRLVGIIAENDLRKDIASELKNEKQKNKVMESMFRESYGICNH